MKVKQFEFNMLPVNTYVVWDEHTHEAAVIDAGCYTPKECETLKEFISEEGLTVKYLLNTHLHFDHIFGIADTAHAHHGDLDGVCYLIYHSHRNGENGGTRKSTHFISDDGLSRPQIDPHA